MTKASWSSSVSLPSYEVEGIWSIKNWLLLFSEYKTLMHFIISSLLNVVTGFKLKCMPMWYQYYIIYFVTKIWGKKFIWHFVTNLTLWQYSCSLFTIFLDCFSTGIIGEIMILRFSCWNTYTVIHQKNQAQVLNLMRKIAQNIEALQNAGMTKESLLMKNFL